MNVPKNCTETQVLSNQNGKWVTTAIHTRELPKTVEQEIAENIVDDFANSFCQLNTDQKIELHDLIERGLKEVKDRTK